MITKCVGRQELMKLWTWQGKSFSLTKGTLDSRNYSTWYKRNPKAFEKLWRRLGTCQIIWCYQTKEKATFQFLKNGYKGKVLWELDVPGKHILKRGNICSVAWSWIMNPGRCPPPFKLDRDAEKDFHCFWENKKEEELWEALFLNGIVRDCSQLLIRYPVEKDWIDYDKCEFWENVKFIDCTLPYR